MAPSLRTALILFACTAIAGCSNSQPVAPPLPPGVRQERIDNQIAAIQNNPNMSQQMKDGAIKMLEGAKSQAPSQPAANP